MKRISIVVEGQSEKMFVDNLLRPYLADRGIFSVVAIPIKHSRGGLTSYHSLKRDIVALLREGGDIVVTTFIDFFRLPDSMPRYNELIGIKDKYNCIEQFEKALYEDIANRDFVPYIQLHEFETLLFSSDKGFEKWFSSKEYEDAKVIVDGFDNPELINSSPENAPSKRILSIKPNYRKVLEGNIIALEIGLETMIERCPHFKKWVAKIIEKAK